MSVSLLIMKISIENNYAKLKLQINNIIDNNKNNKNDNNYDAEQIIMTDDSMQSCV